jgi:signal transduction histidine kinase
MEGLILVVDDEPRIVRQARDCLKQGGFWVMAAGLVLRVTGAEDLPSLVGDIGRLEQVLNNLMVNAIRHTPFGGTITLAAEPLAPGVRVSVSDTGEGIPLEDQPHVFDRFWRGARSRSRTHRRGTGLGLAIARQPVEAQGGRIDVRREPGRGPAFRIELLAREDL